MTKIQIAALLFVGVSLAGCGKDTAPTLAAGSSGSSEGVSSDSAVCGVLTELVKVQTHMDVRNLEAMQAQVPHMADVAHELTAVAPDDIRDEARVLSGFIDQWRTTIEDPAFVLDPNTLYIWETAQTQDAGKAIAVWAQANCAESIQREALTSTSVLVCLPPGATSDDVQSLFARTQVPSKTGRGVDLLDGIGGVSARHQGIAVELDAFVSPERKSELIAILAAPPVVSVGEDVGDCN
jgi:hypothetical protein